MSTAGSALLWVDAVAGGGRVEIYSREVSKADALRMFASARSDTRAFEEDLTDWVATEIVGDVLYAGYFWPKSKGLDEEEQVSFALVHACDAISKHFGIDATRRIPSAFDGMSNLLTHESSIKARSKTASAYWSIVMAFIIILPQ
ncbi:hypothetical protein BURKHO8Y_350006 [Burkholderia sp. 8Y]|uniref:hypothetical protein n=1 Tax=Burkholderia sp. 8Y TaxID=2653133 RepID=UPI0012F2A06D|nr:hypothetical protein [Burkholderia sp. 8Y]VXC78099.1 hypothetical protein BURKHO8Y_350006 [Burkholderia sp. 8Y]